MAIQYVLLVLMALLGVVAEGATQFKDLHKIFGVNVILLDPASSNISDTVVRAGSGRISVTWAPLNSSVDDSAVKTVDLKLCFGAPSQVDRPWRKSNNLLSKDKACGFNIGSSSQAYTKGSNGSLVWTVSKDVPFAHYFVRAYGMDASGQKVAYGQSTDSTMKSSLFTVEPISGRRASIDIAAGVFSAFAVLSLVGFFIVEKSLAKSKKGEQHTSL